MSVLRWPVAAAGGALVALGGTIFALRATQADQPLFPEEPAGLWRVEIEARVRGRGRATVTLPLPQTRPGQSLVSESAGASPLELTIEHDELGNRLGQWRGRLRGNESLRYQFRLVLSADSGSLPEAPVRPKNGSGPERRRKRTSDTKGEQTEKSAVLEETLEALSLPPSDDPSGRLRAIYAFVENEIETEVRGPSDPLEAVTERFATPLGKARLLSALAEAAGLPARVIRGLEIDKDASPRAEVWVEVKIADDWISVHPTGVFFAERPAGFVALRVDDGRPGGLARTDGAELVDEMVTALPVLLSARERADAAIPVGTVFEKVSLFNLPLSTQTALRLLLLLPFGALLVSLLRVLVGLKTFGGFLPMLLAVAFRESSLVVGLSLTGAVVLLGVLARLATSPLNLLFFPRASLILSLVILAVTGSAIAGQSFALNELFVGVFFPVVILSLLIERFTVTVEEEGIKSAMKRTVSTLLVVSFVYPVINNSWLEYLMFAFPELVLSVMGLLVLVGGYTGYRLLDIWRFRFLRTLDEDEPELTPTEQQPAS